MCGGFILKRNRDLKLYFVSRGHLLEQQWLHKHLCLFRLFSWHFFDSVGSSLVDIVQLLPIWYFSISWGVFELY